MPITHSYVIGVVFVVVCATFVWRQRWHFWDERHYESLEKMALIEAKHGIELSAADASNSSSPTTSLESWLGIKPESFSATSRERWVLWIRKFKGIAAFNIKIKCNNWRWDLLFVWIDHNRLDETITLRKIKQIMDQIRELNLTLLNYEGSSPPIFCFKFFKFLIKIQPKLEQRNRI